MLLEDVAYPILQDRVQEHTDVLAEQQGLTPGVHNL